MPSSAWVTGVQTCALPISTEDDLKLFRDAGIKVIVAPVRTEDQEQEERTAKVM